MSIRNHHQKRDKRPEKSTVKPFKEIWIKNGIDEEAIEYARNKGKELSNNKLTTTQIRNVFGEMRRIQLNGFNKEIRSFLLLKPKLAYTAKRHKNPGVNEFFKIFEAASGGIEINSENNNKQYQNLIDLFEAILAYHKYYGGQE